VEEFSAKHTVIPDQTGHFGERAVLKASIEEANVQNEVKRDSVSIDDLTNLEWKVEEAYDQWYT
jgi:hypothetical protein